MRGRRSFAAVTVRIGNDMGLFLVTITAFVAGMVNAVAGGGTFLTFPALTTFAGLEQKVANMVSTEGLWPGSAASVVAAWKDFARIPRGMLIAFSAISLLGGAIGSWLILAGSARSFELAIPWLLAFATIVFGFSKPIARWAGRQHGHRTLRWTMFVGFVQIFIAIYGGYFGAGIGVLMLAGLAFAGLDDIHQMNALKVLLATLINGVAAFIFLFSSQLNWTLIAAMAAASTVGGFLGMFVARRIKPDHLRAVILSIGILLTLFYFGKNYHLLPMHHASAHESERQGAGIVILSRSCGCAAPATNENYGCRTWHARFVACGVPPASFVARAASPWLAVFRERRSYSTDKSKSAAFFIESQKDRVSDCLYRWSTIDQCGLPHFTGWQPVPLRTQS